MMMPGREYQAQPSRFGFNGKENDNEVKGFGNQQDYGMRVYDTRLGKFLSVDPITGQYPELTPYQFASNRPVDGVDMDGLEWELKTIDSRHKQFGAQIKTKEAQALERAENEKTRAQNQALIALSRQPSLRSGREQTWESQARRDHINFQLELQKNLELKAALDPICYGGPGFGQGLVRDPLFRISTMIVCPGCAVGYGSLQVYSGLNTGDYWEVGSWVLTILTGSLSLSSNFVVKVPFGFKSSGQFNEIVGKIQTSAKTIAGDVEVGMRGSRVSGYSFSTGQPAMATADFDFFIVSDDLFNKGVKLGLTPSKGALNVGATLKFPELAAVESQITSQLGSKATIRIFSKEGFNNIVKPEGNFILKKK